MIKPKIKLFIFSLLTAALFAVSCHKKNDIIPDVAVDFYIDINDPRFVNLNAIGGSIVVSSLTNNDRYASGFAGSGIIVARGVDEFFAYDRTCPHDYMVDGSVVRVEIDQSGFAKAVCPTCKSQFELISFGTPVSGPAQYPLKYYRAMFDGRFVHVWNN